MKKISLIIPFLNEAEEVIDTLENLKSTCDLSLIDVIVVEDGSDSFRESDISRFGIRYVRNDVRLGVALSRDIGTYLAECDNAIIIDAHMRFLDDSWVDMVCSEVEENPTFLFCSSCVPLTSETSSVEFSSFPGYYGAALRFVSGMSGNATEIIEPKWNSAIPKSSSSRVQCVLGAFYAFNVREFQRLRGLEGLMSWGGDEQYISLKYWLSGGECRVLSDVRVGHIFREKAPYSSFLGHLYFNKMLICSTILPSDLSSALIDLLPNDSNKQWATCEFRRKAGQLFEYRRCYQSLFRRDFHEACNLIGIKVEANV
jgi:glycosyltransferase involved in cell wall biosynthesis